MTSVAPVVVPRNVSLAPEGNPDRLKPTDPLNPLPGVTVTGKVLPWLCCKVMVAGAEMLNAARVVNVAFCELAFAPAALVADTAKL